MSLLLKLIDLPDCNPIDIIAALKNNEGISYSMNPRTMVPLLAMLPKEDLADNQHIVDFVKSLNDESFSEVKATLKLYQQDDITDELEKLRMQMDLEDLQKSLIFSSQNQEDVVESANNKRKGFK